MAAHKGLGVPLWDYKPRFEFSLSMAIRLDAAEELTNFFSGSLPKYHADTLTVITQLEHLNLPPCRWAAETKEELELALTKTDNIVRDRVIPFFLKYQDLMSIALAANPVVATLVPPTPNGLTTGMGILADRVLFSSGMHPYRAMSSITLAHLARLSHFDALVSRYRNELLPITADQRDKFDKLVLFLKEREVKI